jgi:hypothetical protein
MKRKSTIVYQTILNTRRVYDETTKCLNEIDWSSSCVDYAAAVHGDPKIALPSSGTKQKIIDMRGKTNGSITDLIVHLMDRAIRDGYKYVCFLDDDGYMREVDTCMLPLIKAFDKNKKMGAGGFLHGRLMFFQAMQGVKCDPGTFIKLEAYPWATMGFQIYRVEMLKKIDYKEIRNVRIRGDVYMFMLAYEAGYDRGRSCAKMYFHQCSGAVSSHKKADARQKSSEINRDNANILMRRFGYDDLLRRDLIKIYRSTYKLLGYPDPDTAKTWVEELKKLGKEMLKKGNSNAS